MKIIFFVLIALVIGISIYGYTQSRAEEPERCKLARHVIHRHIREMQADDFMSTSTGGGFIDDINLIIVGFELNKIVPNIDEARWLYVHGVERLLAQINNDETIRPHLHRHPFTVDNLQYQMSFQELPVDASGLEPVVYVSVIKGDVFYRVYDPSRTDTNPLKTIHEEPYSEALRIVREAGLLPDENPAHTDTQ
jgi:hypothetical protein